MDFPQHATHKPGEMAKVYVEPKRTTMPDDPDRIEAGEIPQVPETYAYLNAAYPIMNEHQLAIGETTFGGKTPAPERQRHHRLPGAVPARARAREDGPRGDSDRGRADEDVRLQRLRRGVHVRGSEGDLALRDPGARQGQAGRRLGGGAHPRRPRVGVGERPAHPPAEPLGHRATSWRRPTSSRSPQELGWWRPEERRAVRVLLRLRRSRTAMGSRRREWRALSRHRAVAQARRQRRELPDLGEGREEAVGQGRPGDLPRTPTRARRTT